MPESGSEAVASLPTGMDPSIHSDVFARYERGVLEIERRVDDIRNFTHPITFFDHWVRAPLLLTFY
jgi:hypothetical protein